MKEESNVNPSEVPDKSDTDVASLLKGMQQQLLFLEKKLDLLISQSQGKPSGERASPDRSFRKRPFSKPFRSFDHPQRHGQGERGHNPRERDSAPGHFYERRPGEKGRSPSPRKKSFSFKPKDRE
jgi:hypothetical protein